MTVKTFEVQGANRILFDSVKKKEVVLSGPAGTGKTYACLLLLHLLCLKYEGVRVLMVRKTLESLKTSGLATYRDHIAKELLENGDVIEFGGSTLKPASFTYATGSSIILGGMDKPGKVLSSEYDVIYVQEANQISLKDWQTLTTRIRNRKIGRQQIIGDCNPDSPKHWLKTREANGTLELVVTTHKDNPAYYDEKKQEWTAAGADYLDTLRNLTGLEKLRYFQGIWASAEGIIYDGFSPADHVLPADFPIPYDWTRYWAIDFGFNNPFVLQMWAEDPDGRLYLYKEIYKTKRIVEDHARTAMNVSKNRVTGHWEDPKPRRIICDHDAEGAATFKRHTGLSTTKAKKDVITGIELTKRAFFLDKSGKPRVYFLEDAVVERDKDLDAAGKPCSTLEELTGYVWDTVSEKAKQQPEKEIPLKVNDHGMDAMRYLIMERDRSSLPRLRFIS